MDNHVVVYCGHPVLGAVEATTDNPEGTLASLAQAARLAGDKQRKDVEKDRARREGERLAAEASFARLEAERQQKLNVLRQRAASNPDIRLIMEVLGL